MTRLEKDLLMTEILFFAIQKSKLDSDFCMGKGELIKPHDMEEWKTVKKRVEAIK